jgi:CheY-like chemotaxis protein
MTSTVGGYLLLVDDDTEIRSVLAQLLETEGYRVAEAANGRQALEYLSRHPGASLILLDLMMPIMGGYEFREVQRTDPAIAEIPVVAFTAASSVDARRLDTVPILRKPLSFEELLSTVRRALGARA